jgi:hypothetical protein
MEFLRKFPKALLVIAISGCNLPGIEIAIPGDNLQAILDKGEDLVLKSGATYEITGTLRYKSKGQRIYTAEARYPSEYATLKLASKEVMMLINAGGVEDAVLERVICDGDRYNLSVVPKPRIGGGGQPALVHFGGRGGDGQIVRNCVFMNTRTWSTLKMHEEASNMLVEDNLFFGAGVDPRGNGRDLNEVPFGWADCISCAASDSVIRNNLMLDPTDVGAVLYCAPGTIVEKNVVAAISRESLGGINLVDPLEHYRIEDSENLFDYRGVKVQDNYIDAFGARIHMAIPVGCVVWVPHWRGNILLGGEVTGNTIAGGAGGYGIVAHGISEWKITGNVSTASYSGLAEYGNHPNPPDEPGPFIFDAESVVGCELQPEFIPAERHIEHLLRTQFAPEDANGYQMHDYGHDEIKAVVHAAYLEMLRRAPTEFEFNKSADLLRTRQRNADGLRRQLMNSKEFQEQHGNKLPAALHPFRVQLWFDICDRLIRERGGMYEASKLYRDALSALHETSPAKD